MARKKTEKGATPVDFIRKEKSKLLRRHRKVILFNDKELAAINNYCSKYGIKSRSSFIRNVVISHILVDMDQNYPTLF
ncbi:MAG: hypothetical protein HUJ90_07085 [Bacteroidales bacterium]|nr:hypothetical protein [Bacteroidales bacterium]